MAKTFKEKKQDLKVKRMEKNIENKERKRQRRDDIRRSNQEHHQKRVDLRVKKGRGLKVAKGVLKGVLGVVKSRAATNVGKHSGEIAQAFRKKPMVDLSGSTIEK